MKPTKHAGEKSVRTNVTTESHGDHGDPSQASTRSANPDLAPKDRIKRAMDDGRHNDAAKMLLAAIGSPGARGIPTTLVTRVVTELINDRTIQCGKVEKTEREAGVRHEGDVLIPIASHLAGQLDRVERNRLYALACQRGKIDTSVVFISAS